MGFLAVLVAEQAVQLAGQEVVNHPADGLEAMCNRFLLYGVAAPFRWILRLRAYGKKVQTTSTGQGYICWDSDRQTPNCKDLGLTIPGFRCFVQNQAVLAQAELKRLFLLRDAEMVPPLALHALQDDPANNRPGWSFPLHSESQGILSTPAAADGAGGPARPARREDSRERSQRWIRSWGSTTRVLAPCEEQASIQARGH